MVWRIIPFNFKNRINETAMKGLIIKIIIFSLLLLPFRNGFSQQYFIKTYTIEDGLPTRFINDACQDNAGLMWFATNYGVSKYDGFSFTNYNFASGIPDSRHNCFF
jgi:ligand-binding sensor domain-containing protein